MPDSDASVPLISQAQAGNERALASLFEHYSDRLKRMIHLRMDARIRARCDASDVLQESFIEMSRRMPEFAEQEEFPFFLWLRRIAYGRLTKMHRRHLGALMRTANRETSFATSDASSALLASHLAGHFTSVHRQLERAELEVKLRSTLDGMDDQDREILALRHFEEMSTEETAILLGLTRSGVLKRYTRALRRLGKVMRSGGGSDWIV